MAEHNAAFLTAVRKASREKPPVLLIHGNDPEEAGVVFEQVLAILSELHPALEVTYYTGEPGDEEHFHANIFNPPLFATARLIVHRKAENLKSAYSKSNLKFWEGTYRRLPDYTYVAFLYEGDLPADFSKIFGERLLEFKLQPLYANQIVHEILATVKAQSLSISDDALNELKEKLPLQSGAVHRTILKFKERYPGKDRIDLADLQDLLYPGAGLNVFRLVEAMFQHNLHQVAVEMQNYNPATDDFFAILKIILNRLVQVRKLRIGQSQNFKADELSDLVGLRGNPYFKKRLLAELEQASARLDGESLGRLLQGLIDMQIAFRTQVSQKHQNLLFDRKILTEFL